MSKFKILVGLSGSISTYKVCDLLSKLVNEGYEVRTLATPSALKFIGKATLEGLTGHPVLSDDFTNGEMMSHIHLGHWADAFVIAPASAQSINSLASGTGNSILISTFLAYDLTKPLLIVPAMNTRMLSHPTTSQSLERLDQMGCIILPTDSGNLACGEIGAGRLISTETIYNILIKTLARDSNKNILITAGGTEVLIDNVRTIKNTSTGQTGAELADFFLLKGYNVDLLLSHDGVMPKYCKNIYKFKSFDDLKELLIEKLKNNTYDQVFHAAAVSDFSIKDIDHNGGSENNHRKIESTKGFSISFKPNEKLVSNIKQWSKNSINLVAFKLTDSQCKEDQTKKIKKLMDQNVDYVVHNDISLISNDQHIFSVYHKDILIGSCSQKKELGPLLEELITKNLPTKPRNNEVTQ